ncbi:uncharacterized protein PHACADRAFT_248384 [Phanerochaete carnosa HHB-10118-sp]|uniref:Protein kinase domain-containing protein n=1 Tax=Phanerochaete carnosa (strain HHB-10118-sp) TaxID=650164 RepID=K5WCG0_PHACS|nr:uncharacterized protein PHACADRAFT_248384 [Phanerochaete carnosa HHB-10118-sp]EKM61653.1 hypothetical protein PHACADRAFT_248384 [Phanerochaete carnosa HHB-10118-sp]
MAVSEPRAKLKSVLGFAASGTPKDVETLPSLANNNGYNRPQAFSRRSIDSVASYQVKGKTRTNRTSVADGPFFEEDAVTISSDVPGSMRNGIAPRSMPSRRIPGRGEKQEGHWTISVAETPHDTSSYSLYVKTPTHNLTLTRSAVEIVEVDGKLRDTLPGLKLPKLPLDASSLPSPPKKKGNFLITLSRFASPSSKSSTLRQASLSRPTTVTAQSSSHTSSVNTPVASPSQERDDPFSSFSPETLGGVDGEIHPSHAIVTALGAYLTAVANDPDVRQTRVWKRFVRVRTDDLQSARPERAIKRVRSDLAAHPSPSSTAPSMSQVLSDAENIASGTKTPEEQTQEEIPAPAQPDAEQKPEIDDAPTAADEKPAQETGYAPGAPYTTGQAEEPLRAEPEQQPSSEPVHDTSASLPEAPIPVPSTPETEEVGRSTPTPSESPSSRNSHIVRSQSADPMQRASRIHSSSSAISQSLRGSSSQASMTGDDSSISTTGRRSSRKKRSKSVDPAQLEKKKSKRKVVIDDFELVRVLGKGCAGKVLLVRHKPTSGVYALKAITKRHVLAHQELQHTLTEQAVLKRMAAEGTDPFVVRLWWSFHDKDYLYLVMDFHPGGDLATQLARLGRLGRDRARFYAVEIVEGVEGLHAAGVIYRDLKPENILIASDGHIVLTDFGLSKEFPRRSAAVTAPPTPSGSRNEFLDGYGQPTTPPWMEEQRIANPWTGLNDTTTTFCGTAEYLAPEVIQGLPYSYEVDWWSFGTMLYEMLVGITPFWADNHSDMYYRVLQDELVFPDEIHIDRDTRSLIRGLLQRNPALRMKEPRIKKHPYFSMIDWSHVYHKRYIPPFVPPIDPLNAGDTQNFDDTYLEMEPVIADEADDSNAENEQTDNERTDGEESVATPSQSRSPSVHPEEGAVDVFDGYSFKGRHSVILDDEGEEGEGGGSSDEDGGEGDESEEEYEEESAVNEMETVNEEPEPEPVTPEARSKDLPEPAEPSQAEAAPSVEPAKPATEPAVTAEAVSIAEEETHAGPKEELVAPVRASAPEVIEPMEPVEPIEPVKPAVPEPEPQPEPAPAVPAKEEIIVIKPPVPRPVAKVRARREKSGIPALDRDLENYEEGAIAERDEEEDDWDFVETNVDEERNGAKGAGLFTRGGVVDRYRLTVFRKSTTRRSNGRSRNTESEEGTQSPALSEKQRRGRNPGLTFRKSPKEFLRTKSPPPSLSSNKSRIQQALSSVSTASSAGPITPSASLSSALPVSPSLKSKESAVSVGSPSESSDQSVNGDIATNGDAPRGVSVGSIEEKQKNKVLKKYKEGAEKMLSIFQSPR